MFAKIKAQAAAAAGELKEQASKAAGDFKDRIDTGVAGKKLLDEGGEGMKLKLLAKQATIDASSLDNGFVYYAIQVASAYKVAAEKMQTAAEVPSDDQKAFKELGEAYTTRSAELNSAVPKLGENPKYATISAAESDAIGILQMKTKGMSLHEKLRGSVSSLTASTDSNAEAGETKGFVEKAKENAQLALDRAKERHGNATAGKKMVDEGGDSMMTRLLAKKASLDTTSADAKNIVQLIDTCAAYQDSQAKLKEALPEDKGDETPSFSSLLEKHGQRLIELEALLASLSPVPAAISAHESETDGIMYLTTQLGVKNVAASAQASVAEVQGLIAQQTMNTAVSSATGGAVTKVPEGSGAAAVQYAKDNPEQAKAAMEFAADAKGAGKGGGYS